MRDCGRKKIRLVGGGKFSFVQPVGSAWFLSKTKWENADFDIERTITHRLKGGGVELSGFI